MSPAPAVSPRAHQIAATARTLLEEEGADGLSMRRLAERLEMKAPSLYKHFASKQALEATLISIGFDEQAELFRAALGNSAEPLAALAEAYRAYAKRNPQLYRLMYDRPLNRSLLIAGTEEAAAAPGLEAAAGDEDLARAAWAFAHGMTILELNTRFFEAANLDAAWKRGIEALQASPRKHKRRAGGRAETEPPGADAPTSVRPRFAR